MPVEQRAEKQTSSTGSVQVQRTVNDSFQRALRMMEEAGYGIGENVSVVVDPNLSFMGYTFPGEGGFNIVVSGAAVDSGMLEGLLVHEMSHIYRMRSKHPSHDAEIINEAIGRIVNRGHNQDYQQKILHDIVNSLEDLYADDVAFRVFGKSRIFPVDTAGKFFLSWLAPDPVATGSATRDRWINASIMLRNSFALSNMARHGVPDIGNQARHLNERFLSRLPVDASKSYEFFHRLMVGLKENVTREEFRKLLAEYLERFVELATANPEQV